MADDLRIIARLDDQITGPLTKVEGALKRTSDTTRSSAAGMRKEWDAFRGVLGQTNSALTAFASPLSALGIAGGGAALSIGALGGALRGFSQNTQSLDILSKQTGITVKTLQALENMGSRVGISSQTMLGAADNISRAFVKLKRNQSEAMVELPGMNLTAMLKDVQSAKSVEEMMSKVLDWLPKISNLEARRRVMMIFFGTEDIDRIIQEYGSQASKKLQEIRQSVADLTPEARQAAKEFEDWMGRWNLALEKSKIWALTPILKGVVSLFEDIEKHGLKGNEQEQATREMLSPFGGKGPTERERLEGRRAQVQQQLDLLEKGPRDKDYDRKHDRMVEELRRVADELRKLRENGATAQQSSFEGAFNGNSLIQKAALGTLPGSSGSFGGAGIFGGPGGVGGGGALGGGGKAGGGRAGGGGGGPIPAIPDAVAMSAEERNTLALIMKYESRGRNIMNYMGRAQGLDPSTPRGYTAQGYFQMLNSNWRRIAPKLGIKTKNAMASTLEEQTRVALYLLRHGGIGNWSRYNAALRAAIARGEKVPVAAIPKVAPSQESAVPPGDENGNFPNGSPRALKPKSMAGDPSVPGQVVDDPSKPASPADAFKAYRAERERRARNGEVPSEEEDEGEMMRRYYRRRGGRSGEDNGGPGAGAAGRGTLHIKLEGGTPGTQVNHDMDGLFRGVTVSRHRPSEMYG